MRKYLLLLPLLICGISVSAQITLTQSSVGAVGDQFIMGVDTSLPSNYNIGPTGANVSWDFSSLLVHEYDTITFIDPANTPYASDFPNSNLAIEQASQGGALLFAEVTSSYLEAVGLAADFGLGTPIVAQQNPGMRIANFPFTYLDAYLDTAVTDVRLDASGFGIPFVDSARFKQVMHRDVLADAHGSLQLWGATYNNTLRVKVITTTMDSTWIQSFGSWMLVADSVYTDSVFTWWDDSKGYLLAEATYLGPELDQLSYQDANPVGLRPEMDTRYRLYPNPASSRAIMEVPETGGTLEIHDLQGRLLQRQEIQNSRQDVSVDRLSPGVYLYRFHNEGGDEVRNGKLMIQR